MTHVDSASDGRTANNAVRQTYRVLSDAEKAQMVALKDKGAELLTLIDGLGGSRELSNRQDQNRRSRDVGSETHHSMRSLLHSDNQ